MRVVEENVREGKMSNFETRTWGEILNFDLPYDPGSDMHYGSKVDVRRGVCMGGGFSMRGKSGMTIKTVSAFDSTHTNNDPPSFIPKTSTNL